jgi:sec-independent protein translocase protein TatC
MRRTDNFADPEDIFADTRMSFGDHIEELRTHLIRAILGFVVGMLVSFTFGNWVVKFITRPVEDQLMTFYNRRAKDLAEQLNKGDESLKRLDEPTEMPDQIRVKDLKNALRKVGVQFQPGQVQQADEDELIDFPRWIPRLKYTLLMQEAQRMVLRPPLLSTMSVMEAFMVWVKVCAVCGIVLSSPWVFWQLWAFVAAGLYPHEKRYIHVYLPVSVVLFLAGVLFCEFLVIPKAISALLWFNEWLGLEPDLRLNEWLTFALILPVVFGISFQTPLVMLFLAKLGIFDADSYRKKRRLAWFAMAAFAAIITPVDAISMLLLWIPMCALYELGILMVQYTAAPPESPFGEDAEAPAPDEMVEV